MASNLSIMRKRFLPLLTLLFCYILLATSCSREESDSGTELKTGYSYFPIDSGLARIYQVDSIFWDEFTGINDTVSYQIKEVIAGTFTDNTGRKAQRIERFREDAGGNWIIDRVWSAVRTETTAEVIEENTRFLKLVFPVRDGEEWNGNTFNPLNEQIYEVISEGNPDEINNLNFDKTIHILQDDFITAISRDYDEERYAEGVGLYFRENISYDIDIISGKILNGFIYRERLLSYQTKP